ncbi:Replication protein, DnaD/DnaB domain [Syntrophomonas zehnderi OL-4]|uniref:Replication protein, DnaD/DnaB domain n=1 Tax=Syntrophomonas zehnderi OL-4 TaxID=690567 RepID=A0A0E4GAN3_9FIRM|nr:DnaD domain protein [Syntrophomonas zehnderi]CFX16496.1 Replication protein, DnaD/DnaB domain [Syntrophomonas zehnderi OL-4]
MNGKPLTGNRIRETVDGNPTPNNTIYTKLEEEEEEKENEIENIHETKHISEIKPDQNNNSNPDQEILVFQNYTGIDLKGDGRKSTYQKWRTEWGFSQEMIMKAAELTCQLAKIPNLQYIDKILDGWMAAEIRTIEAADLAIKRFKDLKHERKGLGVNKKPSKNESLYSEFKLYVPPEEIDALKRKEV